MAVILVQICNFLQLLWNLVYGVSEVADYKSDVRIAKFKKAKVYKSTRAAGQFIQLQRLIIL